MHVFVFESLVMSLAFYALMAVKVWAFVDSLMRSSEAYVAAGKLTKPAWVAITAIAGVVLYFMGPLSFFGLPAVVAGIVYLVDVRPALKGMRRGNSW